ncbi:MAG TPA: hypothetical protein VM536_22535 [Chloroflexia bacterium]|nr:hypothetical protein [Chloroflexia bacterium]
MFNLFFNTLGRAKEHDSPTEEYIGIQMPRSNLLLVGAPAALASAAVLALSDVGTAVWIVQAVAVCLAFAIAWTGTRPIRRRGRPFPAGPIVGATLVALATPLFVEATGPSRWLSLGPISLYVAPVVLPTFLIACFAWLAMRGRSEYAASAAVVVASLVLALQPDASQALALFVGTATVAARLRSKASIAAAAGSAVSGVWAFSQPDTLQPLPYVEEVFALALRHSLPTGIAVVACAAFLVIGLHISASRGRKWLSGVATYYGVLFVCSTAGLTPAPLVGYGAGPLLGFGLLVAAASWLDETRDSSPEPTSLRDAAQSRG